MIWAVPILFYALLLCGLLLPVLSFGNPFKRMGQGGDYRPLSSRASDRPFHDILNSK